MNYLFLRCDRRCICDVKLGLIANEIKENTREALRWRGKEMKKRKKSTPPLRLEGAGRERKSEVWLVGRKV